ncbi:MAG: M48 family metallopeptidase [Opitutaceae bacterium]
MTDLAGTFLDGRTSRARPVRLRFEDDGSLHVSGDGVNLVYTRAQVRIESRLGNTPRFIRLPDDARCEVRDNDTLDRAVASMGGHGGARWLHRLEASWRLALASAVIMAVVAFIVIRFGLPLAAKHIAYRLPMSLNERIGTDALQVLDHLAFEPSALPLERQAELEARFRTFLARQGDAHPYDLEFRASPKIGANAFALPDGTIVMTDELVELAENDDEIIAVLAHECGHVQGRHALRTVLQNSAVVIVFTLATGDMSTVSAVAGALPTLMLESKYSRLFEVEADAYGVEALQAAGIDPSHLAHMLQRLSAGSEFTEKVLSYISSHPPTKERIEAITHEPENKSANPATAPD